MSVVNYPVYVACNFLAVNFYEDISSTFEEYLCDALIEESTFLLKRRNNIFPSVDDLYRRPWEELPCDKEFIAEEANNIKDSIALLCQSAEPVTYNPKWFSLTGEDFLHESKAAALEENVKGGKDLDILRERALGGNFLIDEPPLPFDLGQYSKIISLSPLLKKLPMMEVEDLFDSLSDISFENDLPFFEEDKNEVKQLPTFEIEIPKEMKLSQVHPKEIKFFENSLLEDNCVEDTSYEVLQSNDQPKNLRNSSLNHSFAEEVFDEKSKNEEKHFSKTLCSFECNLLTDASSHTNSLSKPFSELSPIESKDVSSSLENYFHSCEINSFDCGIDDIEMGQSEIPVINPVLSSNNVSLPSEMEFDVHNSNSEIIQFDKGEIIGYSFTDGLFQSNKPLEDSNDGVNSDHMGLDDWSENEYSEEESNKNIETYSSRYKLPPLIQKLSNLQFKGNFPATQPAQNLPFLPNTQSCKNIHSCTAVRKVAQKGSKVPSLSSNSSMKKVGEPSSKVPVLFNFMNIRKLVSKSQDYPSSQTVSILSQASVTYNQIKDINNENISSSFQRENCLNTTKSLECTDLHKNLVLKNVEEIFVKFPDAFIDVALIYEAAAIPFLQSLVSFDRFNFPSNQTLANIPSYKTCFLLNQEAKHCQDNHIKNDERVYYKNLLCFHGIIKSLEVFLGFDPRLAISALSEFQISHESLLKGQYNNLIRKLTSAVNNLHESYSIHPKVKELFKFIKENSKFYKENNLVFKVLLILRKHLNLFYNSFEEELKSVLPDIKMTLIPESIILHSSSLMFKNSEDTIYLINASSLSKQIPWKDLKLVVEYEFDSSCWKSICVEQDIPHIFVKVSDLPLKTLEEIKKLPFKRNNNTKMSEKYLILSSYVATQYQLLYILETKLNVSIRIRQYKELLPHIHFADIVVDEKSAVILISEISLSNEDFSHILYDRVKFLHLKYENCWIIIQEKDKNFKVIEEQQQSLKNPFWTFYLRCKDFSEKRQNFNIKILHALTVEEIVDFIKYISAVSSRGYSAVEGKEIFISNQVSQDELFLLSFPCFNPYVVHLILSKYSLREFINSSYEECHEVLYTVPERFFKCFYSTLNKSATLTTDYRETLLDTFHNSELGSTEFNDCDENFELVPSLFKNRETFPMQSIFPTQSKFTNSVDKSIQELLDNRSQNSWQSSSSTKTIRNPDLTLQEIDLDYMALKLGDTYDRYSLSGSECANSRISSNSSNSFTLSPKEEMNRRDSQVMSSQIESVARPNALSYSFHPEELINRSPALSSTSEYIDLGLSSDIFQMKNEFNSDVPSSSRKQLYFDPKPYFFTPKRKYSSDSTESSSGSPSSSKRSCRTQKGVSSKTVTKQDFMYSAPSMNNREIRPKRTDVQKDLPPWPVVKRSNADITNYFRNRTEKLRNISELYDNSSISAPNHVPSPIPQSPMLSVVKVPGNGGQTKLMFL